MSAIQDEEPIYREIQQFRQKWIWALVFLSLALLVVVLGYGMVKQLILGRPWGNRPMSDGMLAVVGLFVLVCGVGAPLLLYVLRLATEVRAEGLYVRFFPFRARVIRFTDIEHCEARTYRPIIEYGGWGIRWGLRGRAYNVSGNRGVQLVLAGGRRLLIGSQRPDELAEVIRARMGQ